MGKNCILAENVTKSYAGRKVVDDLSFNVNKGEVFGLLGHNGAGKSTTIDMLLGLVKPDSGELKVLDLVAISNNHSCNRRVGMYTNIYKDI